MMDIRKIPTCLVFYCTASNLFLYKKKIYESFSKEPTLITPTNTSFLTLKRTVPENNLSGRNFISSIRVFITTISFYDDLTYEEQKKNTDNYISIAQTVKHCEIPTFEITKYE
ncbi:MAG: hypothetical protein E6R13_09320 [Spirochaetes bacterium]|nr:MAG: hypothetical protein E6R13_09320 [Spirochaetota bacterium]